MRVFLTQAFKFCWFYSLEVLISSSSFFSASPMLIMKDFMLDAFLFSIPLSVLCMNFQFTSAIFCLRSWARRLAMEPIEIIRGNYFWTFEKIVVIAAMVFSSDWGAAAEKYFWTSSRRVSRKSWRSILIGIYCFFLRVLWWLGSFLL